MVLGPQQTTLQTRLQKVYVACLMVMALALALQSAGFGTKGWMIMSFPGLMDVRIGLWDTEVCIEDKCSSEDIGEMGTLTKNAISAGMEEYQVEASIALATLLIATVALASTRCIPCQRVSLQAVSFAMCLLTLISGILALVASGKFGSDQKKAHDLFNLLSSDSPFRFPYSLILTGIGGILAIVSSFIILFGIRPWQNNPEYPPAYEMAGAAPAGPYPQSTVLAGPYMPTAQPAPYYAQSGGYVVSPGQPVAYDQSYGLKY